jgi:hypothetical protein
MRGVRVCDAHPTLPLLFTFPPVAISFISLRDINESEDRPVCMYANLCTLIFLCARRCAQGRGYVLFVDKVFVPSIRDFGLAGEYVLSFFGCGYE